MKLKSKWVSIFPDFIQNGILYISKEYKTTAHKCPCGCENVINIPTSGKNGWEMTIDNSTVSLLPSLRNRPCGAHYFIKNNCIVWAGDT